MVKKTYADVEAQGFTRVHTVMMVVAAVLAAAISTSMWDNFKEKKRHQKRPDLVFEVRMVK